jgi:hypothetical protein
MLVVGLAIHWLARVGRGDNIEDSMQSTLDLALTGVGITLFALAAVVWRHRQEIPVAFAVVEAALWGVAAFWPAVGESLAEWMGDQRAFPYQYLFAIALAGSLLGVVSTARRHKTDLPL